MMAQHFNFEHWPFLRRNSRGNLSLYLTYISDDVVLCDKRLLVERGTSIYFKITQYIFFISNIRPIYKVYVVINNYISLDKRFSSSS